MKYSTYTKLLGVYRFCHYLAILLTSLLFAGLSSVSAQAQNTTDGIDMVLGAVVGVDTLVPDNARTARTLGTERSGSGVVIDNNGLIVTVGYLILEASSAEIELTSGAKIPAKILAYDHDSGLGLLRALQPLEVTPMPLGSSKELGEADKVLAVSHGGIDAVRPATVVSRRTFAGYWEYLLEQAIFTAPPHPIFGGAALIGAQGELLGIGSLIVGDALPGDEPLAGNMFIPIDRLEPILGELLVSGRTSQLARPWLGIYAEEHRGYLFINRLAQGGPASDAGLKPNELILKVAGQSVASLTDFYKKIWALGKAGIEVPLTVLRDGQLTEVNVVSGDRYDWLRLNPSF